MLGLTMAMAATPLWLQETPVIMPFHGGAEAAVSLQFDDSMQSQVQNCLPLLAKYKIPATFFINPGRNDYPGMANAWEVEAEKAGHELANHTWTHNGAIDKAHAEDEIHHWSKYFLEKRQGKEKILPFGTPGGVPWNVTPAELEEIIRKDNMFLATDRQFFEDKDGGDPAAPAKKALAGKYWARMGFHGVGGQWLSTSVENLTKVLDYLAENKGKIWVATTGDVYKYIQERDAALPISVSSSSARGFSVEVKTDASKNPFGRNKQALFDAPLTIRCKVPDAWTGFNVVLGAVSQKRSTVRIDGQNYAQFDVIPNTGKLRVSALRSGEG